MRKISGALPETIALIRIATSIFFLLFGQYKIFGPEFTHGVNQGAWMGGSPG